MRHDPLFTSWLVRCPSLDESRRLQQWLATALHLGATQADVVRAFPAGMPSTSTHTRRLGDYFADIRLLPAKAGPPSTFWILFHRRPDAGRDWKDVMVRALQECRDAFPGTTTILAYRGDDEPQALGATG